MTVPQSAPNEAGLATQLKRPVANAVATWAFLLAYAGLALWASQILGASPFVGGVTALAIAVYVTNRFAPRIRRLVGLVVDDGRIDDSDRIADLRARYVDGELSLSEFEARVGLVLDADASHLRTQVERVDGVGPTTSAAIASRFATVETVRDADVDELEAVDGVGPERAAAIDAELGGAT